MSAQRTRFGLLAGVGLGALGLLLLRLGVTFSWELRGVDEQIATERSTLELYARRTIELELSRLVTDRSAAIVRAELDPLLEEPGVVLFVDGEQILPRLAEASLSAPDRLADSLAFFRAPRGVERSDRARPGVHPTDDEGLAERALLLAQGSSAMDRGDPAAIDRAVRAFLVHRARTHLALVDELASTLVLLERFQASGAADPAFLRAVLEKGMSDPKLGRVPGLESELLAHRGELSPSDFDLAQGALVRIGRAAGLDQERFLAVARARPARLVWPKVEGPSVVQGAGGERYAALALGNRVIGVPVELRSTTQRIEAEMMERGLLHFGDQLHVELPIERVIASPAELRVAVARPLWAASQRYALGVFAEKTALLVLCFGLAAGLIGFASRAQRRRQELLDHRTEFVATVSHELRTPLAAVRVLAETLERRLAGDPRAKDYPTRIVKEADRLGALVENILSFQRVERGRWEPKMTRVRIEDLVAALGEEAARATNGRAVLETAGLADVEVWADPELLTLALTNLVRNGIRYSTRDPAVIRLSARLQGDVILAVEDNGIGIAEDEKAQIFEPYVRGRRGSGRGTGLGLALVSKIMAIHRGSVSLAATSEEGSRFELRFPRAQGAS